jgi:hypothetical protein
MWRRNMGAPVGIVVASILVTTIAHFFQRFAIAILTADHHPVFELFAALGQP